MPKKKSTAKSKAAKPAGRANPLTAERATNKAITKTLMYSHYSPEREIVRVNVSEEATVGSEKRSLGGRDIDIALTDLPTDIRRAAVDLFNQLADLLGATPAKAIKPPKNEE